MNQNTSSIVQQLLTQLPEGWADMTYVEDTFPQVAIAIPLHPNRFLQIEVRPPWIVHDFYEDLDKEAQGHFHTVYCLHFVNEEGEPLDNYSLAYYTTSDLPLIAEMARLIPLDCLAEDPYAIKVAAMNGAALVFWNDHLLQEDKHDPSKA